MSRAPTLWALAVALSAVGAPGLALFTGEWRWLVLAVPGILIIKGAWRSL